MGRLASWLLTVRGIDHSGRQVTRTDRILAASTGAAWVALTTPLLILLVQALA